MHSCNAPISISLPPIDGWSTQSDVFLCPLTPICLAGEWMNDGSLVLVILTHSSSSHQGWINCVASKHVLNKVLKHLAWLVILNC